MPTPPDPERFLAAAQRFQTFFTELQGAFVERESLLIQMALALLSREHVLVTGSPGTAKSQVTAAVLARIVDEHTGLPSLYARQFTESTVQTDLIGPVDFKTLMETGRTSHFTDEGILGAVHAFLDEVFDGRDMLLRSALNVLQERELKEGTHITKGRIECAVMTTNRYLSEVMETSRETLLAFIDRIAFVNFVPRGFSSPGALSAVLRRHAGRGPSALLEAPLTIQDLDVLQSAVDATHLPDAACDALAQLLDLLDQEITGAMRADPTFVPTRFLSTRTAVRSGKILRAACVFDKIFRQPERPLVVRHADFTHLRLHLLLSGPSPEAATTLSARENDPRERHQLATLRTEREAFDRCLARLSPFADAAPAPPPRASLPLAPAPGAAVATDPLGPAERNARRAIERNETHTMCAVARELSALASTRDAVGDRALGLLNDVMRALGSSVLAASLAPFGPSAASFDEQLAEMARVAQSVESIGGLTRVHARRLRGRVLAMTETSAALRSTLSDEALQLLTRGDATQEALVALAEAGLAAMEALQTRRRALMALGLEAPAGEPQEPQWPRGLAALEEDLVALWDAALRARAQTAMKASTEDRLAAVLTELTPEFSALLAVEARLSALSEAPSKFRTRVLATRIGPLVGMAFRQSTAGPNRRAPLERVSELCQTLKSAGLSQVISSREWLAWAAEALMGAEDTPKTLDISNGYDGYYALRKAEIRVPITVTLIEVALRTGGATEGGQDADFAPLLASLPAEVREALGALDLARIDRALSYLDRWCEALSEASVADVASAGLLRVVRDESTLLRFELEARVIGEALPEHFDACAGVRARVDAIHARVRSLVRARVSEGADRAWAETLSSARR